MHKTSALAKGNGFGTSVSEQAMFICALGTFLLQTAKPQNHFPLLHAPTSERHPRARRQRAEAICECRSLSELRKFSGESYSGRYPTSGSRRRTAKYFLVGVRIRNEYPNVAAVSCLLLRVFKTRPGVGIAFSDTPATPSAPPDPAHDRRSALRINSRTPPKATSTGPSSPGAVALGP